jgi:hypothetical protein
MQYDRVKLGVEDEQISADFKAALHEIWGEQKAALSKDYAKAIPGRAEPSTAETPKVETTQAATKKAETTNYKTAETVTPLSEEARRSCDLGHRQAANWTKVPFVDRSIVPSIQSATQWRKFGDYLNNWHETRSDQHTFGRYTSYYDAERDYITALNDWRATLGVGGWEPASHIEGTGIHWSGRYFFSDGVRDFAKAIVANGYDKNAQQLKELDSSLSAIVQNSTPNNKSELSALFHGYGRLLEKTNRPNAGKVFENEAQLLDR